jgi:hypothetical protein
MPEVVQHPRARRGARGAVLVGDSPPSGLCAACVAVCDGWLKIVTGMILPDSHG